MSAGAGVFGRERAPPQGGEQVVGEPVRGCLPVGGSKLAHDDLNGLRERPRGRSRAPVCAGELLCAQRGQATKTLLARGSERKGLVKRQVVDLGGIAGLVAELRGVGVGPVRLLRPLLAANAPPAPTELREALHAIDRHVRNYATTARLIAA